MQDTLQNAANAALLTLHAMNRQQQLESLNHLQSESIDYLNELKMIDFFFVSPKFIIFPEEIFHTQEVDIAMNFHILCQDFPHMENIIREAINAYKKKTFPNHNTGTFRIQYKKHPENITVEQYNKKIIIPSRGNLQVTDETLLKCISSMQRTTEDSS